MPLWKWSKTPASNGAADATCPFPEGMAGSAVNDSCRGEMAALAQFRDDTNGTLTTGGTLTAYTVSSNSGYDTLAHLDGQIITVTMHATSGAAPTLVTDSLTAKPLRISTGTAPPTGAFLIGSVYSFKYGNSVGEYLLLNQTPVILGNNSVVTSNITPANVTYATIQNVGADSLLGNPTGSGATVSEITLGAGLSFSGATLVSTLNPALVPGFLNGLTLSTAGSSATFGIAAGTANDAAAGGLMTLASAYTKTTSSWAVGSGNGALDTSTIANSTWYHAFLIKRTDTGVVDVLVSLSPSSPTMPTNYTLSRRIGSMKTDSSGHWTAFTQVGDKFIWAVPVLDVNNITGTSARVSTTLTVPPGVIVSALFRGTINSSGASTATTAFPSLLETDAVVAASNTDLSCFNGSAAGSFERLTNTSAQIGVRSTNNNSINIFVGTYGWNDSRGK